FTEITGQEPAIVVRAPGRINIIGEHTDYNNGYVMPGAIDRALFFAARPNGLSALRFWALDIDQEASIPLAAIQPGQQLWLNYLMGIADQFRKRGFVLQGLDVVLAGNLPVGAGVSSSAALEAGMATIWNEVLQAGIDRPGLARLAQQSSHEFVGIPCGIMDQFASLLGKNEAVFVLDCRSLDFHYVDTAIPGYEWVLLNSKVSHELADSEYPVRVRECKDGVEILRHTFPEVESLRDASSAMVEQVKGQMTDNVYRRCRYVTQENERVMAMQTALAEGDVNRVGELLNATHAGLRDDYEVSCPEIEVLIEQARKHPAVMGARIMGGGFGGCTLNLVKAEAREDFVTTALQAYQAATGREGEFLAIHLRNGVEILA
ncbi:MAG: galactokinase, partial [Lewinella sp.]|nr:galactokinase [Lewinella sp.]